MKNKWEKQYEHNCLTIKCTKSLVFVYISLAFNFVVEAILSACSLNRCGSGRYDTALVNKLTIIFTAAVITDFFNFCYNNQSLSFVC